MKKLLLVAAFILFAGVQVSLAQNTYPIPSYNVPLNCTAIEFTESGSGIGGINSAEKRDMEVVISSSSHAPNIYAVVWFYKNPNHIEGPFIVPANTPFTYTLPDSGGWSVLVKTDYEVEVSVWYK
jgi:hypothetical protein